MWSPGVHSYLNATTGCEVYGKDLHGVKERISRMCNCTGTDPWLIQAAGAASATCVIQTGSDATK